MPSTFINDFFDSDLYKEILARNDQKQEYVVRTNSDSTFYLRASDTTVLELHFPEEVEHYVASVNS